MLYTMSTIGEYKIKFEKKKKLHVVKVELMLTFQHLVVKFC